MIQNERNSQLKVPGEKSHIKPYQVVPLTLSSANGVTTIKREVFDELSIKCKRTEVKLPAVVVLGAGI